MGEQQHTDEKTALKDRLDQAGTGKPVVTRETIIAEGRAEDQMQRALDALHKWQQQNAPTPAEAAVADAARDQRRQETLRKRNDVIQSFNATKPPGEQIANLTPPKATDQATPLPASITGK